MTTKQIIALLVTKLEALDEFTAVVDASAWQRAEKTTPMAMVGFAGSQNVDGEYGCLSKETYTVLVVCNLANESEDIYELIELVRSTIHGNSWSEDVWPFLWDSTQRSSSDTGTIAYDLTFTTQHNVDRSDL
jgi:hypothetical protein